MTPLRVPLLGVVARAQDSIPIGTTRDKAIALVPDGYWYHEYCGFSQGGGEDLFFYGSHDYDKATIVIVHSEKQKDGYQVSQIATFEPYAWHTAYEGCIDKHQFNETMEKQ